MSRRPDEELPLTRLKPVEDDVRDELADHLTRRAEELMRSGMSPENAQAAAEAAFGDVAQVGEICRTITRKSRQSRQRVERLDALRQDVSFALRLLRRSPGFAAIAVLTLALGIGANTAMFSVINGVILRPLPYPDANRIVNIVELHKKGYGNVSWPNFLDLRERSHAFTAMAEYGTAPETFISSNAPARVRRASVSTDFFAVLGITPMLGRLPTPDDHRLGALPVAVISAQFWREHFAAAPQLAALRLRSDRDYQVVGVLPDGFGFPQQSQVWTPIELNSQGTSRTSHNWAAIGRLHAHTTAADAEHDLNHAFAQIALLAGQDYDAVGARVTGLQNDMTHSVRQPLFLLMGASGLLLLIACSNLAGSLLARGAARTQELAVRTAIGAGRLRLIRQILTECLVIALLGCVAGLALAMVLVRLLVALAPSRLATLGGVQPDWRVLLFTAATAIVTAFVFGLLPALRVSDINTSTVMRSSMRGTAIARPSAWNALVASQVMLAVVLLIGSAMLLRSFASVLHLDVGFEASHVMTTETDLSEQAYPDVSQAVAYHDRELDAIRAIPGVEQAGVTNLLPFSGDNPSGGIEVEGKPHISTVYPVTGAADYRIASTGYFAAMKMRLIAGRDFVESDVASSLPVAVVNEAFARREWPTESAIGKRFRIGGMDPVNDPRWVTIIGVVHDVPSVDATVPALPTYYFSYRQLPYRSRWLTTVVRTTNAPETVLASLHSVYRQLDANVPPESRPLTAVAGDATAERRFTTLLLSLFAGVALLLAAAGLYGIVSYTVTQQHREIGIRIALGAEPARVARSLRGRVLLLVGFGVLLGWGCAFVLVRTLHSMLYGVSAHDPSTFAAVGIMLLGTALGSTWWPVRRGTRIDPVVAMRGS